jgi:hypothetical protein
MNEKAKVERMSKEMIRENVEAWCDALESGEYEQTKGALYKDGGYCCLGVARCVLTGRRGRWSGIDLTRDEQDALGIRSAVSGLIMLNDGWGNYIFRMSFDQIAEVIRREHPVFRDDT